jgi:LuxR family transcriptional regulator, quorum-sensing system regulator BjaR1
MLFHEPAFCFLDRCSRIDTKRELFAEFSKVLDMFGFNRFMMTRLPPLHEDPEPLIIEHTWSRQWIDHYREQAYFWADPVSTYSFVHNRPYTWSEAREKVPGNTRSREVQADADAIGMLDGLGFPMQDLRNAQSVVSLSSDKRVDLPEHAKGLLYLVAINAALRAEELLELPSPEWKPLSPREKEALKWVASGKTNHETSIIMNTAEKTVERQLTNAREKLQASNTTHAVAKALYTRQIIL